MTPRTPTASGLDRALRCPASLRLPQRERPATEGQVLGTINHNFLEHYCGSAQQFGDGFNAAPVDAPRRAALELAAPEHRERLAKIDLTEVHFLLSEVDVVAIEEAVVMDHTGIVRRCGRLIDRSYPIGEGYLLAGTADLVVKNRADGIPEVIDWKSGNQDLPLARESGQLRGLACAWAALLGADKIRVRYGLILDDEVKLLEPAVLDADDLRAVMHDLYRLRDEAAAAPRPGAHCKGCSSFAYCPAQTELAIALATGLEPARWTEPLVVLDPIGAGEAWERIKRIRAICDEVEAVIKMYAESAPVPLPSGKVLAATEVVRETIDADLAEAVLPGPVFHAAVGVKRTLTKSALKAACKSVGGLTMAEAENALREAGAMRESPYFKTSERAK